MRRQIGKVKDKKPVYAFVQPEGREVTAAQTGWMIKSICCEEEVGRLG